MLIILRFGIIIKEKILLYYILFNSDLTASEAVIHFLITIFVYMISLAIHEFFHAFAAFKMGDPTAKLAGRMTLNPFKHLDMMGFLMFIFLGVGWAKPVPVNPLNFKKFKKGTRVVSIAGVSANFVLGLLSAGTFAILLSTVGVDGVAMGYVYNILMYFMIVNSFLVMFNILPIPPMDGFNFISSFLKPENGFIKFMAKNGYKVLIGLLLAGFVTDLFFGFDIFNVYLALLNDFIYWPIAWIGV